MVVLDSTAMEEVEEVVVAEEEVDMVAVEEGRLIIVRIKVRRTHMLLA